MKQLAGISKTIHINIKNIGTQAANNFTVYLIASGSVVVNQAFTNQALAVNGTDNVSVPWTPSTAGTVSLVANVSAPNQPGFVSNIGEYSTTVNVTSSFLGVAGLAGFAGVMAVVLFPFFVIGNFPALTL